MKIALILLLLSLPHEAWAAEFFKDKKTKNLISRAEFWHRAKLKKSGFLPLPEGQGVGHVVWGVANLQSFKQSRAMAWAGAVRQVKIIYGATIFDHEVDVSANTRVKVGVTIQGRRYQLEEVALWIKAGQVKRAFLISR